MFFLLCFLFYASSGEPIPNMEMEVIGSVYKDIYVASPAVKQDGKDISKYDYSPVILAKMVLSKKTANYYYDANIDGIYNIDTISLIGGSCNYKARPFECANENDHYILKTDIQITHDKAYISMILFDEDSMPVASSIVSKKLRREIIPRKKTTTTVSPNGLSMGSNTTTTCKDKTSCSSQTRGGIYPSNTTGFAIEELPPTIIDFPAIINSNDVSQAVQLLYSSLQ